MENKSPFSDYSDISAEAGFIKERYARRKNNEVYDTLGEYFYYNFLSVNERDLKLASIIKSKFGFTYDLKMLEIGAGAGNNLLFFKRIGFNWRNIFANELLEDRSLILKENFPSSIVHSGNAVELNYKEYFDIVFQSTVFTSILRPEIKKMLADKMFAMTKPGGIILWYDFMYNNPSNKDVKGVGKSEVRALFSDALKIDIYPVTLAPPIGRRIGKFYPVVNFIFPFLRTHLIAVIHK